MEQADIFKHIDHTLLKAVADWEMINKLCKEALVYNMASVCIPPTYVARVYQAYPELNICTVIGFPLGYNNTKVKLLETETALHDGANEIDMVVNLGDVKNGEFEKITAEIATLKHATGQKILKVIIETCYLTEKEKIELCSCVTKGGANFIKTSTGFGTGGAIMEDVLLFKKHLGPGIKIKAAGGVKTRDDLEAFLVAGCERIGTSSAISILNANMAGTY
ncbi:MAG: deoxyribose-phosphate aldolase [Clostridia bacterium]